MSDAFLEFMGDTPNSRILGVLLTGKDFDYSLTDIAENAEVSWSTLHRLFPLMQKQKIVIQTRTIGRAKLFKLNQANPQVKNLIKLYNSILKNQIQKYEEKYLQTVRAK